MSESLVSMSTSGHTRIIRLTRPAKRNALNREMRNYLVEALSDVEDNVRCVVLSAEGSVFCAGLDLDERQQSTTAHAGASLIEPVLDAVSDCPVPVIAGVSGFALAGGCELALACDLIIAGNDAQFGMPLATSGLATTWKLTHRLLDVGGLTFTRQLLLGGRRFTGKELAGLGIVAEAVPVGAVTDRVTQITAEMAKSAPLSLRAMKAAIQRSLLFRDEIDHSAVDTLSDCARNSRDAKEGVAAILESRVAIFEGR